MLDMRNVGPFVFQMYTLLSGLWKYMFQKDEYNVLILGLDNAGKSVSCCQLCWNISENIVLDDPGRILNVPNSLS